MNVKRKKEVKKEKESKVIDRNIKHQSWEGETFKEGWFSQKERHYPPFEKKSRHEISSNNGTDRKRFERGLKEVVLKKYFKERPLKRKPSQVGK
jgi:hypothetical protein